MIVEMLDRKIPKYLKEGWASSTLPLREMTSVELAKAYAYELWRTKSMSDPNVNLLLDALATKDERYHE